MSNIKVRLEGEVNREIEYPDGRKYYSIEGSFQDSETDERVRDISEDLDQELEWLSDLYQGEIEDMVVEYEVEIIDGELDPNIVNVVVMTVDEASAI
jgi:hypothetical protein